MALIMGVKQQAEFTQVSIYNNMPANGKTKERERERGGKDKRTPIQ